jgi:hypothetical protein
LFGAQTTWEAPVSLRLVDSPSSVIWKIQLNRFHDLFSFRILLEKKLLISIYLIGKARNSTQRSARWKVTTAMVDVRQRTKKALFGIKEDPPLFSSS